MPVTRTISTWLNLTIAAFAAIWIGTIVPAAASIPVVGFAAAIPAALVVYVLRAALLSDRSSDKPDLTL